MSKVDSIIELRVPNVALSINETKAWLADHGIYDAEVLSIRMPEELQEQAVKDAIAAP